MSPMTFLQKPYRWLSAIIRFARHDQRRAELRLRSLRPQDHARAAKNARPEQLEARLQRGRAGPRGDARPLCRSLRAVRFPPRGVLSLLRPGRGDADRLRRIRRPAAGGAELRRPSPVGRPGRGRRQPGADGARRLVGCGENLPDQKIAIVDPETVDVLPARAASAKSGSAAPASPKAIGSSPRRPKRPSTPT